MAGPIPGAAASADGPHHPRPPSDRLHDRPGLTIHASTPADRGVTAGGAAARRAGCRSARRQPTRGERRRGDHRAAAAQAWARRPPRLHGPRLRADARRGRRGPVRCRPARGRGHDQERRRGSRRGWPARTDRRSNGPAPRAKAARSGRGDRLRVRRDRSRSGEPRQEWTSRYQSRGLYPRPRGRLP